MEIFKSIEEFPEYSISNTGKIKNKKGVEMVIGKRKSNSGYLQVRFYHEGKYYYRFVHRLLALAFVPNPNNYRTVNHVNGDKFDNRIENLEWASDEMQQRHAFLSGLKTHGISFTKEQLFEIYHMYFELHIYPKKISEILNRPFGTIRKICYGERCKDILREYRDKVGK
jgi:HNH endonuclease/NUMOD4 motif